MEKKMELNEETKINARLLELENQLKELKIMLEKKEKSIYKESLDEFDKTRECVENIDIESYQRELEILEKQIPKQLKKQYKNLSDEEIMSAYSSRLSNLRTMIDEVRESKQLFEKKSEIIRTEKVVDDISAGIDEKIDNVGNMANEIADFWDLVNKNKNTRFGVIKLIDIVNDIPIDHKLVLERYSTLLEYELSKKFGRPFPYSAVKMDRRVSWDNDRLKYDSIFIDESSLEMTLERRNELNGKKEKLRKLKQKAEKHPRQYSKLGIIKLYSEKMGKFFELEITQQELISYGLDPSDFGWKEKEKTKVDSSSIAKTSKEKGVKKSLVTQIGGMFSRIRNDRANFDR